MTPPTDADLDELERLCQAATEEPWTHNLEIEGDDGAIEGPEGGCVCYVCQHGNVNTIARTGEPFSHADARFIAAARTALPRLIAEVRRLRAHPLPPSVPTRFVPAGRIQPIPPDDDGPPDAG